jgi:hypothetical protein
VSRVLGVALALLSTTPLAAQQHESIRRAQAAYNELDYTGAVVAARLALNESLARDEQVAMYELLGYAYGALDSTAQAVDAFRQLIFLDPDREPDVERVSPRITSLYASALGQVLVVRRLRVDSATFVAGGAGAGAPVRFELSRGAKTRTRVVGPGIDMVVDSQLAAGGTAARFDWAALDRNGRPLPEGVYQLITTAVEGGQNEFSSAPYAVRVRQAPRDTLPQLTRLRGYEKLPEMVTPPRDWRPMLLSMLYVGVGSGLVLAAENGRLGTGPRTALISVSGAALATSLIVSLRKPDPRPSRPNMVYNQLLGELLAKQNADIARENTARREQVVLTVAPAR